LNVRIRVVGYESAMIDIESLHTGITQVWYMSVHGVAHAQSINQSSVDLYPLCNEFVNSAAK